MQVLFQFSNIHRSKSMWFRCNPPSSSLDRCAITCFGDKDQQELRVCLPFCACVIYKLQCFECCSIHILHNELVNTTYDTSYVRVFWCFDLKPRTHYYIIYWNKLLKWLFQTWAIFLYILIYLYNVVYILIYLYISNILIYFQTHSKV